jgi:hypothetical protein
MEKVDPSFLSAFADKPVTLAILMTALVVIFFIWKGKPFFDDIKKGNTSLDAKIDGIIANDAKQTAAIAEIKEHIRTTNLDVLRMTIYNESVDMEDRLVAARRYFIRGGNGKVAAYATELVKENAGIWHVVLAMSKPEEVALLPEALRGN